MRDRKYCFECTHFQHETFDRPYCNHKSNMKEMHIPHTVTERGRSYWTYIQWPQEKNYDLSCIHWKPTFTNWVARLFKRKG